MRWNLIFAGIFIAILLFGCSNNNQIEDSLSNVPADDEVSLPRVDDSGDKIMSATVEIYDSGFRPKEVTIDAGGTVRWVNRGSEDHSVQGQTFPQTAGLDKKYSGRLTTGMSWEKQFDMPGFYNYYDMYNEEIKGKVIVR